MKRLLLAAAIGVSLLSAPAAAQAATLAVDQACYPVGGVITVTGTGFTPGATVQLSYSNAGTAASPVADGAGNFTAQVPAPSITRDEQPIAINATDGTNAAPAALRITRPEVETRPGRANPRRRVLYRVRGFTQARRIFIHYIYRGRHRGTVRLTRKRGPCGVFTRRMRMLPVRTIRFGTWRVQVDARRRYSSRSVPRLTGSLTIFRTFR
jgi:hypothetical protein